MAFQCFFRSSLSSRKILLYLWGIWNGWIARFLNLNVVKGLSLCVNCTLYWLGWDSTTQFISLSPSLDLIFFFIKEPRLSYAFSSHTSFMTVELLYSWVFKNCYFGLRSLFLFWLNSVYEGQRSQRAYHQTTAADHQLCGYRFLRAQAIWLRSLNFLFELSKRFH